MHVTIPGTVLAGILQEADGDAGREVCGLLFGTFDGIHRAAATANVAPCPTDSFEIDPKALFTALRSERAGGEQLIGYYHSHPTGSPEPSRRDAASAEPGKIWLIVGAGRPRLWYATPDGFEPMQMIVNQDCASIG